MNDKTPIERERQIQDKISRIREAENEANKIKVINYEDNFNTDAAENIVTVSEIDLETLDEE